MCFSDAFRGKLERSASPRSAMSAATTFTEFQKAELAKWGKAVERCRREDRMKLNDEERDILAGKNGPMPQLALKHQIKVGEFFGAAIRAGMQAHVMADTESLGEAGVDG